MKTDMAVFFDLGDTLASPVVENGAIAGLVLYPFVPEVLRRLRAVGDDHMTVRVGLMSNTGTATAAAMSELLAGAGLRPLVDAELCLFSSVEGIDKTRPAFFARGPDRAALPASQCMFVGEDERERRTAEGVGLLTSPHPLHALHQVESLLAPGPAVSSAP